MTFDLDAARRAIVQNTSGTVDADEYQEALTEIERLRFALDKMTDLYEKMAEERRALRDAQEKR